MSPLYKDIQLSFNEKFYYPLELHYTAGGKMRILTLLLRFDKNCSTTLHSFGGWVIENLQYPFRAIMNPSSHFVRFVIDDQAENRHSYYQRALGTTEVNKKDSHLAARFTVQARRLLEPGETKYPIVDEYGKKVINYKNLEIYLYSPRPNIAQERAVKVERIFLEHLLMPVTSVVTSDGISLLKTETASKSAAQKTKSPDEQVKVFVYPSVTDTDTFFTKYKIISSTFTGMVRMAERRRKPKENAFD